MNIIPHLRRAERARVVPPPGWEIDWAEMPAFIAVCGHYTISDQPAAATEYLRLLAISAKRQRSASRSTSRLSLARTLSPVAQRGGTIKLICPRLRHSVNRIPDQPADIILYPMREIFPFLRWGFFEK